MIKLRFYLKQILKAFCEGAFKTKLIILNPLIEEKIYNLGQGNNEDYIKLRLKNLFWLRLGYLLWGCDIWIGKMPFLKIILFCNIIVWIILFILR
jgi:magnesium-transporting ATPase (P-type)